MTFLCALEAVNLDNLFGDCQDLSTTRGGGLAVLEIADPVRRALGGEEITSGSSQGLMRLEGTSESQVTQRVRDELEKLSLHEYMTVMVAACEEKEGKFAEQVALLKARMRWDQMRSPSVVYPPLNGKACCAIDMVRPGKPRADLEGKRTQSDFTYLRRRLGRERRTVLPSEILEPVIPHGFEVADHLGELSDSGGEAGNLDKKIAVLRFDGNDFGTLAASCRTPDLLGKFSKTTREQQQSYFRSLLLSGAAGWFTKHQPPKLRLEITVYGGDEVTFVAPAWLGWKALAVFYREAQEWMPLDAAGGTHLTYSAGVVFCHHKAPIHTVRRLASELADEAKERAVSVRGNKGNFAVYQVLESFDSVGGDVGDFLETRFAHCGGRGVFLGPGEIEKLERNMEFWRMTLSRRKLHDLVWAIGRGEPFDLKKAIEGLVESKSAAPDSTAETLLDLHSVLGDAAFSHILELWDYAGVSL